MNPINDQLGRLFSAAAQARAAADEVLPAMPFGLETRVLAAWRDSRTMSMGVWNTALLLRGLIVACAIMFISLWPALSESTAGADPYSDFLQQTDSIGSFDSTP